MSENYPSNWAALANKGVVMESSISGGSLWVHNLDLETALIIGCALTLQLDTFGDWPAYSPEELTLEAVKTEAAERIASRNPEVFVERRPADRNCAVRVESWRGDEYKLIADIRNAYEDKPELEGNQKLQRGFIEAIESLDL
jgi:hypothetical protein